LQQCQTNRFFFLSFIFLLRHGQGRRGQPLPSPSARLRTTCLASCAAAGGEEVASWHGRRRGGSVVNALVALAFGAVPP
jgi:hypothetical protein